MPNAHGGSYSTTPELVHIGLSLLPVFIFVTLHAEGRV